jgi:hypothetical protein
VYGVGKKGKITKLGCEKHFISHIHSVSSMVGRCRMGPSRASFVVTTKSSQSATLFQRVAKNWRFLLYHGDF